MEIINYRRIDKGCVKSSFTVCIPQWGDQEIDATLFEKEDGRGWVNFAAQQYVAKDGTKKSRNQCRWNEKTTKTLYKAIRDKIDSGQVQHFQQKTTADEKVPF
jgi:hypothetical protein